MYILYVKYTVSCRRFTLISDSCWFFQHYVVACEKRPLAPPAGLSVLSSSLSATFSCWSCSRFSVRRWTVELKAFCCLWEHLLSARQLQQSRKGSLNARNVLVYSLTFYNDDDGDPGFSWTRLHSDTCVSVTFSQLLLEASSVSGSKRKGRQTHFTELLYTPPSSQWAKWDWFYLLKVWFDSNLQFFQVGGPQLTLQFTEQAKK